MLAFAFAGFALIGIIWLERRNDVLYGNYIDEDEGEGEMSELEPTPELPGDTRLKPKH